MNGKALLVPETATDEMLNAYWLEVERTPNRGGDLRATGQARWAAFLSAVPGPKRYVWPTVETPDDRSHGIDLRVKKFDGEEPNSTGFTGSAQPFAYDADGKVIDTITVTRAKT